MRITTATTSSHTGVLRLRAEWRGDRTVMTEIEGHVPYAAHKTEIIDQTTNFLWWTLDLTGAAT